MKKSALISIFFIVLMLGSTLAYSILSAVNNPQQKQTTTTLPPTNIIDYELSSDMEDYLLQNGMAIAKFTYITSCLECQSQKSYLESFARQYPTQIFLEELKGTSQGSSLVVNSYKATRTLTNVTNEKIFDAFCDAMLQPPVDCALNEV